MVVDTARVPTRDGELGLERCRAGQPEDPVLVRAREQYYLTWHRDDIVLAEPVPRAGVVAVRDRRRIVGRLAYSCRC